MKEIRFNSNGTDAVYLANANMFFAALFTLEIFRNSWPEAKLGSQSTLEKGLDWFRQMFEGGLTGNRLNIAARKTARKNLDLCITKILYFLTVMGDESDIAILLNTGVVREKTPSKGRRAVKVVAAQ